MKNSVMNEVFKFLGEKCKDSDNNIVLLAVEFTPDGYPITQSCKVSGNPAAAMCGLQMIKSMADEQLEKVLDNIHEASNMSGQLDDLINKIGFQGLDDPDFLKFLDKDEKGQELKSLLAKLKSQFGK